MISNNKLELAHKLLKTAMAQSNKDIAALLSYDDEEDGDSDWEATNVMEEVCSADGSESIASTSTADEASDDEFTEPPLQPKEPLPSSSPKQSRPTKTKPKPKAKAKTGKLKAKPRSKLKLKPQPAKSKTAVKTAPGADADDEGEAAASPPAAGEEPVKRRQPVKVLTEMPGWHPPLVAAKEKVAAPPPKLVKYSAASESGVSGRPMKNARAVVPPGHEPSEYPSIHAFRQAPPVNAKQYLNVVMPGRKPAVCRGFQVKSLQPPHPTTIYALSAADDDEKALRKLGVRLDHTAASSKALARAAQHQHKNAFKNAEEKMEEVEQAVKDAIGWLKSNSPEQQPAIMCPELADRILSAAPAGDREQPPVLSPQKSKKRDRPDDGDNNGTVAAKRFAQNLQELVGGTVTSITFSVNLANV